MKPLMLFEAPLSKTIYATRAYRIVDAEKGLFVCTGKRDDITDQVEALIERRIAEREKNQ